MKSKYRLFISNTRDKVWIKIQEKATDNVFDKIRSKLNHKDTICEIWKHVLIETIYNIKENKCV